MATLRTNTVRYLIETRTTDVATNTTLGTATRYDTATVTIDVPETGSRTFLSAIMRWSFRYQIVSSSAITGVRRGIKLGAAGTVDSDTTISGGTGAICQFEVWEHDVTTYFQTNFGAGASQTLVGSIAVASNVVGSIGGGVSCELELTYQYDDDVGTTRIKSIPIPIGSQTTTMTTSQTEIGADGSVPCPANQIPLLLTYLPETSKVFKNVWICAEWVDATASTGNYTSFIQIDAVAEFTRATHTRNGTGSCRVRDNFAYDVSTFGTGATHKFSMRSDVTARMLMAGATMWVTYTYNKSTTTRIKNWVDIPLTESASHLNGLINGIAPDIVTKEWFWAQYNIVEPGTITIGQSAVYGNLFGTSGTNVAMAAGGQAERTYTVINISTERQFVHRGDHSTGWVLARGTNRLGFSLRYVTDTGRTTFRGYLRLVYESDVPAGGPGAASKMVMFINATYPASIIGASIQDVPASGGGQQIPVLDDGYAIQSVIIHAWTRQSGNSAQPQLMIAPSALNGEYDGVGFLSLPSFALLRQPLQLGCWEQWSYATEVYNKSVNFVGKLDLQIAHRQAHNGSGCVSWCHRIAYHSIGFTVAGQVSNNGIPAPDGGQVTILAIDGSGVVERVGITFTSAGAFSFTQAPDDTRGYWAMYDGAFTAQSALGQPSVDTFDIVNGSVDVTLPTFTVMSPPPGSAIGEGTQLVFRYADNVELTRLMPMVKFLQPDATFRYELIHDGDNFTPDYTGSKTVVQASPPIVEFRVNRRGGWGATIQYTGGSPQIVPFGVDTGGNEVA